MGIRNRVQGSASAGNMAAAAGNRATAGNGTAAGNRAVAGNRAAAGNKATAGNRAAAGNREAAVCYRMIQTVNGVSETMLALASPRIMAWAVPYIAAAQFRTVGVSEKSGSQELP